MVLLFSIYCQRPKTKTKTGKYPARRSAGGLSFTPGVSSSVLIRLSFIIGERSRYFLQTFPRVSEGEKRRSKREEKEISPFPLSGQIRSTEMSVFLPKYSPPPPYPPHPEPFSSSPRVLQTRISLVFLSPKHHSQKIGDFCLQAEDRRPHPRFWLRFIFSAAALLRAGLCVFFWGGGWSGGERNQLIALLGFPSAIAGGSTAAAPFSCSAKSFAPVWVHKRFLSAVHLQSAPFQGGSFH